MGGLELCGLVFAIASSQLLICRVVACCCGVREEWETPIQLCSSSRKSQVDDTMMDPYSGGLAYRSGLESGNRGS